MANTNDYIMRAHIVDDYHSIEEDFIKLIEYFPLYRYPKEEDMKNMISPKLADLLLRIGSKIDISLKSHINNPSRKLHWGDYKILEPKLKLTDYSIFSTHYQRDIKPFADWQYINMENKLIKPDGSVKNVDFWWNAYNDVKHHPNSQNANLYHVYYSLSAFFSLMCRFKVTAGKEYSIKLIQYNYLNVDALGKEKILRGMNESHNSILTKLFLKNL